MNNQKKNIPNRSGNTVVKPKQSIPVKQSQSSISGSNMNLLLLGAVAVIIFVCFHYTLYNQFLNWDDWIYITKDKYITSFTASHFNSMLFRDITLNYFHPLTMLSLAVNYQFFQLNPMGYYFTNIMLHILNAILVFYCIKVLMEAMVKVGYKAITPIPWLVAIGALLHGIHPMHVESVAWISERKDVMYSVFYFIGIMMYVRYTQGVRLKWMLYLNIFIALLCLCGIIGLREFSLDFTVKGHNFSINDSIILSFFFILLASSIFVELKYKHIKLELFYVAEFFLLSLFSKPMAVTFPLALMAVDLLLKRDQALIKKGGSWIVSETKALFKLGMEKWVFLIIAFLSGLQSIFLEIGHDTVAFTGGYNVTQKLLISSYAFTMYTFKAFYPANLCNFYPFPNLTSGYYLPTIFYYTPISATLIIFIPLFLARKNNDLLRVVLFGLGFYFANLVFILQFLSAGTTIMAERYSYVSYFGLIFMLIYFAHWLWLKNKTYHVVIVGTLSVICIICGYLSHERTKVWHNPETLWTNVIAMDGTETSVGYLNLGSYYIDSGKYVKAYPEFVVLEKLHTKEAGVYRDLGNIYGMRNQFDSSLYCFGMALQYDSTDATIYNNRAITYANLGKFDRALKDFKKAYILDTTQDGVLADLARTLMQVGQLNEAVPDYSKLIKKHPKEASYFMSRGSAYLNLGNPQLAIEDYLHALELQPNNGESLYNLSIAYHKIKDNPNAIKYANMALAAGYKLPDGYLNTLK
jgi:protein O-mannosyl-transferase